MLGDTKIHEITKAHLKEPALVQGLPGLGYVGKVAVETERRTIGTVAEMNARHIERAIKIQEVAYKQLESGLSDNPVSAYRLALDSERLARGEVTDRTGDEIPPSLEDLDKNSLREIGNIVARARAKRAKEPGL